MTRLPAGQDDGAGSPVTAVRKVPLLIVPPTINKFYVIDLSPGRSLAEYLIGLVLGGRSIFDEQMGPGFIKICTYFPVRHEAPCDRVEVKDLRRDAVAAA